MWQRVLARRRVAHLKRLLPVVIVRRVLLGVRPDGSVLNGHGAVQCRGKATTHRVAEDQQPGNVAECRLCRGADPKVNVSQPDALIFLREAAIVLLAAVAAPAGEQACSVAFADGLRPARDEGATSPHETYLRKAAASIGPPRCSENVPNRNRQLIFVGAHERARRRDILRMLRVGLATAHSWWLAVEIAKIAVAVGHESSFRGGRITRACSAPSSASLVTCVGVRSRWASKKVIVEPVTKLHVRECRARAVQLDLACLSRSRQRNHMGQQRQRYAHGVCTRRRRRVPRL
eukprot:4726728-Prymnesium_polylepis.1